MPLQQAQRASTDDGGAYDEDGNDDCDNRDGNNSNDDDNNNEDDKAQQSYLPKLLNINRNILKCTILPFRKRVTPREVPAAHLTSHFTRHTSHVTRQNKRAS